MREISVTFFPEPVLSISHGFVHCGAVINILYLQIFLNIHSICGILSWLDAVNTLWHVLYFTFNQDRKKWVQVYSCFHNLCLFRKLVFPSCFFCPHVSPSSIPSQCARNSLTYPSSIPSIPCSFTSPEILNEFHSVSFLTKLLFQLTVRRCPGCLTPPHCPFINSCSDVESFPFASLWSVTRRPLTEPL